MIDFCSVVFSQTDQHHFHQAALYCTGKVCVRLDSSADDDVIGTECILIKVNVETFRSLTNDDGLHTGLDGTSAKFFCYAVSL